MKPSALVSLVVLPGLACLAGLTIGCGAATGLPEPEVNLVEPGTLPAYCEGKVDTVVYVVTEQSELYSFAPATASFTDLGGLVCPVTNGSSTPFSMAVDHDGTAYVVFDDGELFLVDTKTTSCTGPAPIDTTGFTETFGMGFNASDGGTSESLYLASTASPDVLGTLDTSSFVVTPIAPFSQDIGESELTGTGSGQLFGFGVTQGSNTDLAEIDPTTAAILSDTPLPTSPAAEAWAFAFWSGDFYIFTSDDGVTTDVGRYEPTTGEYTDAYATLPSGAVVGAGVSTCAPR